MNKYKEYPRDEMLQWLEQYFRDRGFEVYKYSDRFLPARVPLYCEKKEGDITNEVVIEFTTDNIISKDAFFPLLTVDRVKIREAAPVRFYQYYFPKAEIYFAYPAYVEENDEFNGFKQVCAKRGIGLLKTSRTEIEEVAKSRPLYNEICNRLNIKKHDIKAELEYHLRNCLHYFVYYPEPVFKRRAITGKAEEKMSYVLIDKLSELNNIIYNKTLNNLASDYRKEARDDYEIAEKCITDLWDEYLGLEYPSIHRRVENILQRDEVYREHFVHQFQVFLIGAYILDYIYPEVAEKFEEKQECKIENVWLAASTFHDFSYGLQNFDTWLMQFFEDILRIKNKQTKENLNLLNLDAAMIREALFDKIIKIINKLNGDWRKNTKEKIIRFFYEKAVRDRNHGVLSAISLLKLYDGSDEQNRKISEKGILEAAVAIGCHDEDIWEALCGCQGYRRSSGTLPVKEYECIKKCGRELLLWSSKKSRIYEEKISDKTTKEIIDKSNCESWEREIMKERTIDKIEFKSYPILFLLTFCDNIQDEGRFTSLDQQFHRDRSSLIDITINKKGGRISINVKLKSDEIEEKEGEIERVAWCLKDNRFRIIINNRLKKMDGSGGG